MKNLLKWTLLIAAFSSFAQEKLPQRQEKLTPEQRTELQVKKMTLDLALTEKQQKEMSVLLLEQHKKMDLRHEEIRAKKDQVAKQNQDDRFKRQSEMLDNEIALREQVKKLLSPDQYSKWQAQRDQRKDILKSHAMKKQGGRKHQKEQK